MDSFDRKQLIELMRSFTRKLDDHEYGMQVSTELLTHDPEPHSTESDNDALRAEMARNKLRMVSLRRDLKEIGIMITNLTSS